jgi:DegV family protein with EDD domain
VEERIALVTDSTCDLEAAVIARHGIRVLPLKVIYRDRVYHDRVDIQPQEVYDRLDREVPTTSTPSPQETVNLLTELRDKGFTRVLAIHLSSGLSGTWNTVCLAAREVAGLETVVIDSKALSMGLGFVVEQAARWIEERLDFDTVVKRSREMVGRTKAFYVLKTLEYLRRGGRINTVAAAVAGVLDLKPIISITEEGKYYSYRRVRGRSQSLRELFEIARQAVEGGLNRVAVMHGDAAEEAEALLHRVGQLPGVKELVFGQIGPAMVVHTGPGLVGIALTRA